MPTEAQSTRKRTCFRVMRQPGCKPGQRSGFSDRRYHRLLIQPRRVGGGVMHVEARPCASQLRTLDACEWRNCLPPSGHSSWAGTQASKLHHTCKVLVNGSRPAWETGAFRHGSLPCPPRHLRLRLRHHPRLLQIASVAILRLFSGRRTRALPSPPRA